MMQYLYLLAQSPYENRLKGLRGAFHEKKTDPADVEMMIAMIVALAALIALIALTKKIKQRKAGKAAPQHPLKLLSHVLKKMGVGPADRFLMRSLARDTHLQQPTVMLFSHELFKEHAVRWLETITIGAFESHARRRLKIIARRAFPVVEESTGAATLAG